MINNHFYQDIKNSLGMFLKAEKCMNEMRGKTNSFTRFFLRIFTSRLTEYDLAKKVHVSAMGTIQLKLELEFGKIANNLQVVRTHAENHQDITDPERKELLCRLKQDQKHLLQMGDNLPDLPKEVAESVRKTMSSLLQEQVELVKHLNPNYSVVFVPYVERDRLKRHLSGAPAIVALPDQQTLKFCLTGLKKMSQSELDQLEASLITIHKKYKSTSYVERNFGFKCVADQIEQVKKVKKCRDAKKRFAALQFVMHADTDLHLPAQNTLHFPKKIDLSGKSTQELLLLRGKYDDLKQDLWELSEQLSFIGEKSLVIQARGTKGHLGYRSYVDYLRNYVINELKYREEREHLWKTNCTLNKLGSKKTLTPKQVKKYSAAQKVAYDFTENIAHALVQDLAHLRDDSGEVRYQLVKGLDIVQFKRMYHHVGHMAKNLPKVFDERFTHLQGRDIPWLFRPDKEIEEAQHQYQLALLEFEKVRKHHELLGALLSD